MVQPGARLTVASSIPEVLQLPWELLPLSSQPGGSEECSIIRLPRTADGPIASTTTLAPGPLRVLFLAAEPLDYEVEEQSILEVSEGLDMTLAISEDGTWEELLEQVETFGPHLLHLSVQGKVSGGRAAFSMQGTAGRADLRFAEDAGRCPEGLRHCGHNPERPERAAFSSSSALPEPGGEHSSGRGLECACLCRQAPVPGPGRRPING